jgi:hypothetical protein
VLLLIEIWVAAGRGGFMALGSGRGICVRDAAREPDVSGETVEVEAEFPGAERADRIADAGP